MKTLNRKSLCALLMVFVLLLGMCLTACGEKDPVKYTQKLEKDGVKTLASELAEAYDSYLSGATAKETAITYDMDLELSASALSLIEMAASASGAELDLSFLSDISLGGEMYRKDNSFGTFSLMLALGDSDLIGFDVIADTSVGEVVMGIPELITKYVSVDVNDLFAVSGMNGSALAGIDLSKLPEGKVLEALINKYAAILFNGIKSVERAEETVTANGVEATLDTLTITVTEADAMAIAKTLLTEAKADKELETVVVSFVDTFASYMESMGEEPMSGAQAYAELCEEMDEALADIDAAIEENAAETGEAATGETLIIKNYVNRDDEIVGRTVSFDDETLLSYIYAENKEAFGFTLSAEGEEIVRGKGTNDKKLSGDFTFFSYGEPVFEASVKELDMQKLRKDGYLNGTVEFGMDALADMAYDESLSAFLGNYTVRVEFAQKDANTGSLVLGLVDAEDSYFIKLSVTTAKGSGTGVVRPADESIIKLPLSKGEEAIALGAMELLESIDAEAVRARLNALPLPKEYIQILEQYLALLTQ